MRWIRLVDYRSRTIFLKILIVFMLVITPLSLASLYINSKSESSVRREIGKSWSARSAYFATMLETEIGRMLRQQREFVLDKDLQKWVYINDTLDRYEWGETNRRIQEKMKSIKSSSGYIHSVSVQLPGAGQSISSENALAPLDSDTVDAFLALYRATGSVMLFRDGRLWIGYVYPAPLATGKPFDYLVLIELSVPELRRSLLQFANYENSGAALLNLDQGWSVSTEENPATSAGLFGFMRERNTNADAAASGVNSTVLDAAKVLVTYRYSSELDMAVLVYVPEKQVLGDLETYRIWFWMLAIISMLIIVSFAFGIYRVIHRPLNKLTFSFRKVEDGYLEPIALPKSRDEFRYLFERFNSMVTQIKDLIHKLYLQELRTKDSELKQLQSQINPHFLYNTYFILHRLAKMEDLDSVILFSRYLGEYFQFITRNGESRIPLEQEIQHARLYVEIQQIRFSNRIEVAFDPLPEAIKDVLVPKLIVQPIIENAYKYGMEGMGGDGVISVRIRHDDAIRIAVEDNGPGLDDAALDRLREELASPAGEGEVTGIHNVHRRLQFMYGQESGVVLTHGGNGGLQAELVIYP